MAMKPPFSLVEVSGLAGALQMLAAAGFENAVICDRLAGLEIGVFEMTFRFVFAGLAMSLLFGCARNDVLLDATFEPVAGEPGVNALGGLPVEFPPGGPLDRVVARNGAGPALAAHTPVVERPRLSARRLTPEEAILRDRIDSQALLIDRRPSASEASVTFISAERPVVGSQVPYRLSWNGWGPFGGGQGAEVSVQSEEGDTFLTFTFDDGGLDIRSNSGQTHRVNAPLLRNAHAISVVMSPNEPRASGGAVEIEIWRAGASRPAVVPMVAFYYDDVRSTRFLQGVIVDVQITSLTDYTIDQVRFRPASLPISVEGGSF